ncbi:hypothetical protein CCACVL1_05761 [Corchorus capsularis]|uniref:TNase-like domain-containing protein n=1 Tax=Corchorus capsularis TaxID=210143 RepID=A0A1R3JJ47_COCAP|nr:hypothetical protein CCACVL1_05761 [Corchorus capsularis]
MAAAPAKTAELQANKSRLRMWTNYVPPATSSKAIRDRNFTGKVVEFVSGDCIIVADDSLPFGSPLAERRVNLSSITCPKMGRDETEKPAEYAREAREFLRTRLIGKQVNVQMEYSRTIGMGDGAPILDFGSVFLFSPDDDASAAAGSQPQPGMINVAELVVGCGFGQVIRYIDYDALLAAESRAISLKKGIHSAKASSAPWHINDLTMSSAEKAKDFLPALQRRGRNPAVVDHVLSGHRFKLYIPRENCSIAFSFSGVISRDEPYSDEPIALMRRKIMQRNVEIEVETVDETGTFLGSLWEGKTNVAVTLLEAGLAKLQTSFGADHRIPPDAHLLAQAERFQCSRTTESVFWII